MIKLVGEWKSEKEREESEEGNPTEIAEPINITAKNGLSFSTPHFPFLVISQWYGFTAFIVRLYTHGSVDFTITNKPTWTSQPFSTIFSFKRYYAFLALYYIYIFIYIAELDTKVRELIK
jgi:hypothetical protein